MKRATSPYHLFAAAATTDANIAITFSNMPHRGRGRGSASRPYSGGRDQFVTGDAHFRSVRDVNSGGIWRGESGSSGNLERHRHPHFNQNPQFRHPPPPPPPFNQAHQVRPRLNQAHQVEPRFNQAHQVRPRINQAHQVRARPPDFRDWEYAVTLPPADCERFIVLSYNILADYLAIDHWAKLYRHIPGHMLDWQWRKRNLVFELGLWSADILCLQEVDRFHDLLEELKLHGYDGIWKMRTGNPIDGCAIFWRTSRFNLRYEECIEFNKLGLRDNVAQICVLELKNQKGSLQSSLTDSNKVVICNIHVLYNPNRGEIKLGQVRVLLDRAKALSKIWNDAPVVICGDFNCTPKSPLYKFISEQKLNLSGIDRNKVSGQAAAVIRPPRLHGPDSSERSACGSAQVTSVVDGKEVNIEQNTCLSDVQKLDNLDNKAENHYNDTSLDMSAMSLTDVPGENRSALCDSAKVTQKMAVDNSKIIDDADSTKGESTASCSEGRFPVDHINNEIRNIRPMTSSALEEVHADESGMECSELISDVVSPSNPESVSEKSDLDIPEENKHTEFDSYPTSLGEENQSFGAKIDPESTELLSVEMSSTKPSCQMSDSDSLGTSLPKYNESPSVEMSSTKPSSQMSGSNSIKIPLSTNKEIPSFDLIADDQMSSLLTPSQVDKSYQSTNIDFTLDEKLEKLSLDEIDKDIIFSENIDEDDDASRSALHNAEGFQPSMGTDLEKSDLSGELESASENLLLHAQSDAVEGDLPASLTSKSFDVERTTYNPSLWTPMEIETATGNSSCTFLEHPLPLRSTYTEVMDCSGTRDSSGEPLVTSYNRCFLGTVDYIWRSDGLQTIRVLAPIPKHAMTWTPGFPTKKWGSDHIALVSELAFVKGVTDVDRDVQ